MGGTSQGGSDNLGGNLACSHFRRSSVAWVIARGAKQTASIRMVQTSHEAHGQLTLLWSLVGCGGLALLVSMGAPLSHHRLLATCRGVGGGKAPGRAAVLGIALTKLAWRHPHPPLKGL